MALTAFWTQFAEDKLQDVFSYYRYIVFKNYKIIYFVNREKQRIEVVNLIDCRQNPEKVNEI